MDMANFGVQFPLLRPKLTLFLLEQLSQLVHASNELLVFVCELLDDHQKRTFLLNQFGVEFGVSLTGLSLQVALLLRVLLQVFFLASIEGGADPLHSNLS